MRALTVVPGRSGSVRLDEVPEPAEAPGTLLVDAIALGVCGTDVEIVRGEYGWPPPGRERLVLGHESLGRVRTAPPGSGFQPGDLVAGIVRRPDPVPCINCAAGEWDFCSNGRYTERGIKALDGYGSDRWRVEVDFAVPVDASLGLAGVLTEPTSVVAKAWEVVERLGARTRWQPKVALVTGAGPIGLLATLLGVQRGLEVHVLDRVASGPKPALVRALGAQYHHGRLEDAGPPPDIVIECTGVDEVVFGVMARAAANGVVCLAGVSSGAHTILINVGTVDREMVLENNIVVGTVNANRRHYRAAAEALARADKSWLEGLITRRVPVSSFADALEKRPDDVKVVVTF
jgi:threonine dehydrogenase-like Zn-dependent dehydrogenase